MDLATSVMFMFFWLKDLIGLRLSSRLQHSEAEWTLPAGLWMTTLNTVRSGLKQTHWRVTAQPVWEKGLSCWPTSRGFRRALQAQTPFTHRASGRDRCSARLFFHSTRARPGCQDAVMGRAVHHVITELPVYPRLGDRGDLLGRWLGSGEGCERAHHERTIITLASWTQIMLLTECPAKLRWLTGIGHLSWMG